MLGRKRGALDRFRVLDLTQYIAGPSCTALLAGMGAEVIKVERPGGGDPARRLGPFPKDTPGNEHSGIFLYLNAGKKSVTIDLKHPEGRGIFLRLLAVSDLLVESFSPGAMKGLGLPVAGLRKRFPTLVIASVSNFGQYGPYREYAATELTAFAASGLMALTGDPEKPPLAPPYPLAQHVAGLTAALGILISLWTYQASGWGSAIDASLTEALTSCSEHNLTWFSHQSRVRKRSGSRHPDNHPMTILPCRDGHMGVTIGFGQWDRLSLLVGKPELADDPRFETGAGRRQLADAIDGALLPWLAERTREQVLEEAQGLGLPFGAVLDINELLEDKQNRARQYLETVESPESGRWQVPGAPFKMQTTSWKQPRAPFLGEHLGEVLCGLLGYSSADLARWRRERVVS